MKRLVLRLAGAPLLAMTLAAVVCSVAVADEADSKKSGTSSDVDAGALTSDGDWQEEIHQITPADLSDYQIAQAAQGSHPTPWAGISWSS
jgi:hypothetical protein